MKPTILNKLYISTIKPNLKQLSNNRRSVFNIDDSEGKQGTLFTHGDSYDLEEIMYSTVLITRIGQSNVYDIEVIKPPSEQPTTAPNVEGELQGEISEQNQNNLVLEINSSKKFSNISGSLVTYH